MTKAYVMAKSGTGNGLCSVTAPCASLNYALSVGITNRLFPRLGS